MARHTDEDDSREARGELDSDELAHAWAQSAKQMVQMLSVEAEAHLADLLPRGERVIYKIRSSRNGERSQLALTNRKLFIFIKGIRGGQAKDEVGRLAGGLVRAALSIGQFSVRVYPITTITGFEFKPIKGVTVGHFQIFTSMTSEDDKKSRFLYDTRLGYFKSVLVYRKILEIQEHGHERRPPVAQVVKQA